MTFATKNTLIGSVGILHARYFHGSEDDRRRSTERGSVSRSCLFRSGSKRLHCSLIAGADCNPLAVWGEATNRFWFCFWLQRRRGCADGAYFDFVVLAIFVDTFVIREVCAYSLCFPREFLVDQSRVIFFVFSAFRALWFPSQCRHRYFSFRLRFHDFTSPCFGIVCCPFSAFLRVKLYVVPGM